MRILDVGVAAAYGVLCLSLISYLGPYPLQHLSDQSAQDSEADSSIFAYVGSVGLPFLATAPPAQLCSSVMGWDNSSLTMGETVAGYGCATAPAHFVGYATLELSLSGREMEIQAWVEGQ